MNGIIEINVIEKLNLVQFKKNYIFSLLFVFSGQFSDHIQFSWLPNFHFWVDFRVYGIYQPNQAKMTISAAKMTGNR